MPEKNFIRQSSSAVSVAVDLVKTLGAPADWIQAIAAGDVTIKDGSGAAVTLTGLVAGEAINTPIREITSTTAAVRYGTGAGPSGRIQGPAGAAGSNGAAGATGATGAAGAAGPGHVTSTASYTQPAIGGTVTIPVDSSAWMRDGAWLSVDGGGYYTISGAPPDSTHVTIKNEGHSANAAVGATVATAKVVLPCAPALPLYVGSITFNGSSADTGVAVTIPGLTTGALVTLGRGDDTAASNAGTVRAFCTANTLTIKCTQALSNAKIPYAVQAL